MKVEVKKSTKKSEVEAALKQMKKAKPFNAKKYFAKFEWPGDPLALQREWRNE